MVGPRNQVIFTKIKKCTFCNYGLPTILLFAVFPKSVAKEINKLGNTQHH